jgi:hypothetical protein
MGYLCPILRQNALNRFLQERANPIPQLIHSNLWIVNSYTLLVKWEPIEIKKFFPDSSGAHSDAEASSLSLINRIIFHPTRAEDEFFLTLVLQVAGRGGKKISTCTGKRSIFVTDFGIRVILHCPDSTINPWFSGGYKIGALWHFICFSFCRVWCAHLSLKERGDDL